jgi:hypothetical protein
MTAVTIADEKTRFSICFCCCYWFEMQFKPSISKLITCPAFSITREVPFRIEVFRNPCSIEVLAFENDKGRNCGSIGADAFNYCDPFLAPWLSSIGLLLTEWNDNESTPSCSNGKSYINVRKNELIMEHQFHPYYKHCQALYHAHQ